METDQLINTFEAAKLLGLHPETLRRWDKSGKFKPHKKNGPKRRYLVSEIMKLVKERGNG